MKRFGKNSAYTIGLIAIVCIALALAYKPWKTYNSEKYGFSLRYPAGLSYAFSEVPPEVMESEIIDDGVGHTAANFILAKDTAATEINNGIAMSVMQRENQNPAFPAQFNIPDASQKELVISGKKAMEYIYHMGGKNVEYIVENNGYVYVIASFGNDPYFYKLVRRIAPTIQFK